MAPRAAATPNTKIKPEPPAPRLTQKPSYEGGQSAACPPFGARIESVGTAQSRLCPPYKSARPTDPARYPNTNNPASYRADSSAGTVARCDAVDARSARTGVGAETSAPAAASDCPCAD